MKVLFASLAMLALTTSALAQEKQEDSVDVIVGRNDAVVLKKTGADNADPVQNVRVQVQVSDDAKDKPGKTDKDAILQRKYQSEAKSNGETVKNSYQYRIVQTPIPADGDGSGGQRLGLSWNYLNFSNDASQIFIDIDLNNAPVKEAIKRIFQKANREIEILSDVDAGDRVTLKAKKIRLSTALNAVSDQTGLSWGATAELMSDSKSMKTKYHIGKKLAEKLSETNNNQYYPYLQNNRLLKFTELHNPYLMTPTLQSVQEVLPLQRDINGKPKPLISKPEDVFKYRINKNSKVEVKPDTFSGNTVTGTIQNRIDPLSQDVLAFVGKNHISDALTYSLSTQETRSTFTCPHCRKQLTIVSQKQSIKCPDCKRDFLSDWKFCPFDGAKRPANGSEWGFCPICGKDLPHSGGDNANKK